MMTFFLIYQFNIYLFNFLTILWICFPTETPNLFKNCLSRCFLSSLAGGCHQRVEIQNETSTREEVAASGRSVQWSTGRHSLGTEE